MRISGHSFFATCSGCFAPEANEEGQAAGAATGRGARRSRYVLPTDAVVSTSEGVFALPMSREGKSETMFLVVGHQGVQVICRRLLGMGQFARVFLAMDRDRQVHAVHAQYIHRDPLVAGHGGPAPAGEGALSPPGLAAVDRAREHARLADCTLPEVDSGHNHSIHFSIQEWMMGDLTAIEQRLGWCFRRHYRAALAVDAFLAGSEALTRAHAAGVLHGDVKPENLFMDFSAQKIHLADFGSSLRLSEEGHDSYLLVCTEKYAAPEVRTPPVAACFASDVWSLAASAIDLCLRGTGLLWAHRTRQEREGLRAALSERLNPPMAKLLIDRAGAWRPESRPSARQCHHGMRALLGEKSARSVRAAMELLTSNLKTIAKEVKKRERRELQRLAEAWEAVGEAEARRATRPAAGGGASPSGGAEAWRAAETGSRSSAEGGVRRPADERQRKGAASARRAA